MTFAAQGLPPLHPQVIHRLCQQQQVCYFACRWTIKARVSQRSDMRTFSNARGEGKFFTFDLVDAHGGEIRAIAFGDTADKFRDVIQQGGVYLISKASLKPKKGVGCRMHTFLCMACCWIAW